MKRYVRMMLSLLAACVISGCNAVPGADVYDKPVDPYKPVSEEDLQFGECVISLGDEVNVSGQGAWYKGNDILISEGGIYRITGRYDSGAINISTGDAVKLIFDNAEISNPDGYAIVSDADKLILSSEGESTLTGSGGDHGNAVYSGGKLLIAGRGNMLINNGVFSRGGINFGRNVSTVCEIYSLDDGYVIYDSLHVF